MKDKGLNYSILGQSESEVKLEVAFLADYPYFDGHFDDFKILPALLQVHFVVEVAKELFEFKSVPFKISVMKFMKPIIPDMKLSLLINWDSLRKEIKFKYSSKKGVHSVGTMGV